MKTRFKVLAITSLASLALVISHPGVGSAQNLEQRVENLERTVDALLKLMEQQAQDGAAMASPNAITAAPASATPAALPESFRMGQVHLDVHTMSMNKNDVDQAKYNASAIPAEPNGIAVGSILVEPIGRFEYGAFASDPALASFAQANALVQTVWNGVLQVEKTGSHAFQLSVGKEEGSSGAAACRASLQFEDKPIVSASISNADTTRRIYSTEQGSISLQPGLYDFTVYMACIRFNDNVFERYRTTLLMAEPGDRVAKPIPASLFGVRE